jgi:mono/diheme cytochrome c family protein
MQRLIARRLALCATGIARVAMAFAVLLVCAPAVAQTGSDLAAALGLEGGAALYESSCAACHGTDGRGRSQAQLGFELPVPDFSDCSFATREPDGDWVAITHDGGPARGFDRLMPAFGDALSGDQIQQIVDYVRGFCSEGAWPRGDLNMPKALFTEKAFPEDEALVRTTVALEGPSAFTHKFTFEKRFGPVNQLEVSLPITRANLGAPDGRTTGFGDLSLAFKRVLTHNLERGMILSVGSEVVLPTGDDTRGFGSGSTVIEPYVAFGKLLPGDSFIQVQALAELPTRSGLEDEFVLRTAVGRSFTSGGPFGRTWTPMLELLGSRELSGGARTQWDAVPQFQVTLNTRQHIMANVGLRVPVSDRSGRDTVLVFYLLWDWFDGALLDGW